VLSRDNLLTLYQRLDPSDQARAVIDDVRSSDPARRVRSGRGNVSGRYPSKKMGVTIQFESHRVELAAIYEMEHDAHVLEYFDQPPSIKLLYDSANSRGMGVLHTPDFFVIRDDAVGWEEWKTEEDLNRLAEHNQNRYQRDETGRWRCPPGEAYASQSGLYYRVRSAQEIDWIFQRNIQFLDDYLRVDCPACAPATYERLLGHVLAVPGLALETLFDVTQGMATRDEIYFLIATGALSVDIRSASLREPVSVPVFAPGDKQPQKIGGGRPVGCHHAPLNLHASVGGKITWDGRTWRLVNAGETTVSLLSEDGTLIEVPLAGFDALVAAGTLGGLILREDQAVNPEALKMLTIAAEQDLRVTNLRCCAVRGYLRDGLCDADASVPSRTLRRWAAKYRAAEQKYGNGYVGLLPRTSHRGNSTQRLPESTRLLMNEFIAGDYETVKQKSMYISWIGLKRACEARNMQAPSYKTFSLAVHGKAGFRQTLKRQGHRAAYVQEPFYTELDLKTPRHGDRPFEIGHIDHTELDVEVISAHTGQVLGRPWMTLLIDAFSRRVLAFYVTFDAPSYRSCMMILRECVRRHGRLPQIVVLDGGREFDSVYFETLLARYECTKKTRPPAKARFGSVCERLFGITNTRFIHNLAGNTQITRNVRQVTKSVNPKQHATWALPELYDYLAEYLYEIYDTIEHPALGQTPRDAYQRGLAETGTRSHRRIADDLEFQMWTLPTTAKGTAKVAPGRGVKINHVYYWSEALRDPTIEHSQAGVRYDPFDAGVAYVFAGGRWVRCHSEYYLALRGRSEKEVALASTELRRRHQCHSHGFEITAKKLAEFLASVESEEALLLQRQRDRESRNVRDRDSTMATDDPHGPGAGPQSSIEDGMEPEEIAPKSCEIYGEF
jgi:putative transposase